MAREVHDDESGDRPPLTQQIGCVKAALIILVTAVAVGFFAACGFLWVTAAVSR